MLTYSTTMFVLADVKKLAQNMGTSYSAFGKTVKSNTCIRGSRPKKNRKKISNKHIIKPSFQIIWQEEILQNTWAMTLIFYCWNGTDKQVQVHINMWKSLETRLISDALYSNEADPEI